MLCASLPGPPQATKPSRNFAYDALNRINSMTETNGVTESCKPSSSPSTPYSLTWTIDAWGNRNTQYPNQGSCSFNQSVNNQNQLTGTYTYDSAGNLWKDSSGTPTIVYTYDSENRLQSVANSSGTSQYVYNALGQRVSKTTPSGTTYYIFGSDGQVVSERDVNNNWIQTYLHFGGQPVALYKGSATGFSHRVSGFVLANPEFKKDHLGSTRLITLSDRSVYDNMDFLPFGEQIAGGGGSSHKFTGYEYDPETGLDNANARQYSSSFGRFMTPDPAGLAATDLTDPQSWNRLSYTRSNPTNLIDPSGLDSVKPKLGFPVSACRNAAAYALCPGPSPACLTAYWQCMGYDDSFAFFGIPAGYKITLGPITVDPEFIANGRAYQSITVTGIFGGYVLYGMDGTAASPGGVGAKAKTSSTKGLCYLNPTEKCDAQYNVCVQEATTKAVAAGAGLVVAGGVVFDLGKIGCIGTEEFQEECLGVMEIGSDAWLYFSLGAGRAKYDGEVADCDNQRAKCYAQNCQQ